MNSKKKIILDDIDIKLINLIQENFPLSTQPFQTIASILNIPESKVIEKLIILKKNNIIRRIGPIINTTYFDGYSTLVALKVHDKDINHFAKIINSYPEISHNYIRDYELNMWFTLSSLSHKRALIILNEIESKLNCSLLSLPTKKKFKINVLFKV